MRGRWATFRDLLAGILLRIAIEIGTPDFSLWLMQGLPKRFPHASTNTGGDS